MSKIFGFGIIGAGGIFTSHATALHGLKDRAQLLAVSDVDEEKLGQVASTFEIPHSYSDPSGLFERDDIDVVIVATPPITHPTLVIAALEAGKHVVCEKPLAATQESADSIISVSRRFPGKLSTVYQLRYNPHVQTLLWLAESGQLGDLLFGRFACYGNLRGAEQVESGWWGDRKIAGGGVVMTRCIHQLDLLCQLFGPPVRVSASLETSELPVESEDLFAATVEFPQGRIVSCFASVAAHHNEFQLDVCGSQASVHLPWQLRSGDAQRQNKLRATVEKRLRGVSPNPSWGTAARAVRVARRLLGKTGTRPSDHGRYLSAIVDALQVGAPLPVSPEESQPSFELCNAIYRAGETGDPVSLEQDRNSNTVPASVASTDESHPIPQATILV